VWETDAETEGRVAAVDPYGMKFHVASKSRGTKHVVRLDGLIPNTIYDYTVFIDEQASYESSFKTIPKNRPYRVVMIGDTHAPQEGFFDLIPKIDAFSPDFFIHLGDFVVSGEKRREWDSFFSTGRELFDHIPIIPVVGNHDLKKKRDYFYRHFFAPAKTARNGALYYTFEVGGDLFIVLDTESSQITRIIEEFWLIKTLLRSKMNHNSRYIYVVSHEGIASFKGNRTGSGYLKYIFPLLKFCGVSALFSGHDHHYIRGKTHFDQPFFILGGGSNRSQKINRDNLFAKLVGTMEKGILGVPHFLVMDIHDEYCKIRTIGKNGNTIDEITIEP
jgi:predicted phosphodiesterase